MGCSGSKPAEESEAVVLCRGRTELISEAVRHRYSLSSSHSSYSSSLLSLAHSLHRFLHSSFSSSPLSNNQDPLLPLPPHRKGGGDSSIPPPALSPGHSHRSVGENGSHIDFRSSSSSPPSDDNEGDHQDSDHNHFYHHHEEEAVGPTYVSYHYAKNQPQQPSTVHYAPDPSSSSSFYSNFSDLYSAYPSAGNFYGYFGNSSSMPPPNLGTPPPLQAEMREERPPPPPPPPPRVSNWDFLNPFELLQDSNNYYYPAAYTAATTPSRSSRDVRDEEGIPELEEEDDGTEHEVVKEVHGDQKFVDGSSSRESGEKNAEMIGGGENSRSVKVENGEEQDVVEKNVVAGDEGRRRTQGEKNVESSGKRRSYRDVSEIGSEIRVQFERAAAAASELSKLLEVGKQPYRLRKSSVIAVSTRMMCMMPPPASSGEDLFNFEEDGGASSVGLSAMLQKLYFWEEKLLDEVRAEERMRCLLERNHKRLRHLVERGSEANKIDDVQKMIRKLSTKIRVAIQVVDSISNKINKLRDEELWPQINELIQGLEKMWKVMLECHQIQCQAISEAVGLDSIANGCKLNDTCLNEIVELELELLRWTGNFSSWINAQKNCVKALNGWLKLCLHYEPEITADGVPPYSPGRIGAPPIFVICNSWAQAVDMISEMEVINAAKAFAAALRNLWEKNGIDPHHKIMPNADMDRLVKARVREAQIINKEFDALNKKLVLVSGQSDIPSHSAEVSSLHLGLKQIFEALENFSANSLKAYEELHRRSEEVRVAKEDAKLSG